MCFSHMSFATPPFPLQNSHRGLSPSVFFLFLRGNEEARPDGCISSFVGFCVFSLSLNLFFSLKKKWRFAGKKLTRKKRSRNCKNTKARYTNRTTTPTQTNDGRFPRPKTIEEERQTTRLFEQEGRKRTQKPREEREKPKHDWHV